MLRRCHRVDSRQPVRCDQVSVTTPSPLRAPHHLQTSHRTLLQTNVDKTATPLSALLRDMYARDGVVAFYRGVHANCARACVLNGTKMCCYDTFKGTISAALQWRRSDVKCQFASAVCAGFVMACTVAPIDMVRTTLMNQHATQLVCAPPHRTRPGPHHCFYPVAGARHDLSAVRGPHLPTRRRACVLPRVYAVVGEVCTASHAAAGHLRIDAPHARIRRRVVHSQCTATKPCSAVDGMGPKRSQSGCRMSPCSTCRSSARISLASLELRTLRLTK